METLAEYKKEIAELTDCNNHSESLIQLCKYVAENKGEDSYLKSAEDFQKEHEKLGYLTMDMSNARYALYQEVKTLAEEKNWTDVLELAALR